MATADLTPTESAILIVLMVKAREVLNTELTRGHGMSVEKDSREKLNDLKLIVSTKVGSTYSHQLADKGWVYVQEQDLDFVSRSAKAVGIGLELLQKALRDRVLPRSEFANFNEMFGTLASTHTPSNLDLRIRHAYAALASEPGAWVGLARLRPFFGDVPRSEVDEALRRLNRASDVNIVPESNQKALRQVDIEAAVRIGDQDKHLLAIGV